jgi:hypothetical protein
MMKKAGAVEGFGKRADHIVHPANVARPRPCSEKVVIFRRLLEDHKRPFWVS